MKCIFMCILALGVICMPLVSVVHAADKDPFVLIPEAKDTAYGTKVDKLTNPNTDEGKKFWNAYNSFGLGYTKSKESSDAF